MTEHNEAAIAIAMTNEESNAKITVIGIPSMNVLIMPVVKNKFINTLLEALL